MARLCAQFLLLALLAALPLRADEFGAAVAKEHAERAGDRLAALKSYYAEGRTLINNEVVQFRLWAARPDRLRVESFTENRRVVQCYDGRHEPWIGHTAVAHGNPEPMSPGDARDFIANADFDDPLVDYAAKGYTVDYAGEERVNDRRTAKLLVMSARNDVLFMWVDAETHEIVKRSYFRITKEGERQTVDTYFSDFRDVGGVLQPHRVETKIGDATLYLMVTAKMEPNSPQVTDDIFAPPPGWEERPKPAAAAKP
jgi:outer membrane lipoprotein-sorting protein